MKRQWTLTVTGGGLLVSAGAALAASGASSGGGTLVTLPDANGEGFELATNQDPNRSGAGMWGGGILVPGPGGGSGRLGDLIVRSGETVVLDTDSQEFAPGNLLDNYDPVTGMPGTQSAIVEDGVFEFASVDVKPGGVLRFEGSHAARLYARGTLNVQGTIDVSGESPPPHPSSPCDPTLTDPTDPFFCDAETLADPVSYLGQSGGRGGPGGGDGGAGGDLPDADATLQAVAGLDNPNAVIDLDGRPGQGVPFPSALDPQSLVAFGNGGVHWPGVLPPNADDLGEVVIPSLSFTCTARQAGAAGAGGAHASSGAEGSSGFLSFGGVSSAGPPAPVPSGGDHTELALDAVAMTLDPDLGFLRGGAGGGGGGAHVGDTRTSGAILDCLAIPPGETLIGEFVQSSGAGGGGGGGAFQGQAGSLVVVSGRIDASGGDGGPRFDPGLTSASQERLNNASAGGSGAGGGVLLQGPGVQIAALPGRVSVAGGEEMPSGAVGAPGGRGGAGLVRVESGLSPELLLDLDTVLSKVDPDPTTLATYPGAPASDDVVSVATWDFESSAPGTFSGAQSCWLFPFGQPLDVVFPEDGPNLVAWNLFVVPSVPGVDPIPFRGRNGLFHGSLEDLLGSELGLSPIVVRFQGARAVQPVTEPCFLQVEGPGSAIVPGSLTPWVRHPAELNDFFGNPSLAPNMVRYQIVFDRRNPTMQLIEGVTDLTISVGI